MLSTGSRAALLRTVPWYEGTKEKVAAIKASIAAHDPATAPEHGAEPTPVAATSAQPVVTGAEPVGASVEPDPAIDLAASMRALLENEDAKRAEAQRD
jgi:hypothetical protein